MGLVKTSLVTHEVAIQSLDRKRRGPQTVITVRREAKARLELLLNHTEHPLPMVDIVSAALDAVVIPKLTEKGLMSAGNQH